MAFIHYVLVIAVFCIADSMQSPFEHCANGLPAPKNVNILGCNKLPCNLKRGTSVEAIIDFTALQNIKTLKPDVDVQIGTGHVKYPLPQQNACKSLVNGECPLDKGEVVTYKLKMPVEKMYPRVALTIQLSLVDQDEKSHMCIRIPAQVVD
ncbi:NPC intracellular cholesterol transporter 2 [Augochlora pura]